MNAYLLQRLTAIQQVLLAHKSGSVGLPSAVAGAERETFLREFLEKIFPAHRRFSSGAITDAEGNISGQVDIAIEFGFSPSFPMPNASQRLLLAESVAAVVEVKSDLQSQWSEVVGTTAAVKRLRRNLNAVTIAGDSDPTHYIPVIAVGYAGHSTTEGLAARLSSTAEADRPDGALVIQSGCFVGFGMTASGPTGLYALALSIDVLFRQLISARPDLQHYVQ
ncbi:DUF6602 domain-containing protein [Ideonella sp. BN130291]|uniref:DUF6602 domain-containing protein n=1 Tax=Ideonella sp. BN130291 TaxID=3112940 RepID=UPI002E262892|nr:DUF6602 domain-containing protein [Ideonella sp. BN130291]